MPLENYITMISLGFLFRHFYRHFLGQDMQSFIGSTFCVVSVQIDKLERPLNCESTIKTQLCCGIVPPKIHCHLMVGSEPRLNGP
jgi:hypothetical protein